MVPSLLKMFLKHLNYYEVSVHVFVISSSDIPTLSEVGAVIAVIELSAYCPNTTRTTHGEL